MKLLNFIKLDKSGASAAEYALILAVLGGIIVAALTAFGGKLNTAFDNSGTALTATYAAP